MAKRLVARVGTFNDKDGNEKGEYVKVGVILSNDNGEFALIDPTVNLAGVLMKQRILNPQKAGDSVMCGIYDDSQQRNNSGGQQQQNNGQQQNQQGGGQNHGGFNPNDDIAF